MKKRFIVFYTFKDSHKSNHYGSFIHTSFWKSYPSEHKLKTQILDENPGAQEINITNLIKVTRLEARHWLQ